VAQKALDEDAKIQKILDELQRRTDAKIAAAQAGDEVAVEALACNGKA
jgi:hypothetical protein